VQIAAWFAPTATMPSNAIAARLHTLTVASFVAAIWRTFINNSGEELACKRYLRRPRSCQALNFGLCERTSGMSQKATRVSGRIATSFAAKGVIQINWALI